MWLMKTDSNGEREWNVRLLGYGSDVKQTNDGGYLVLGGIYSFPLNKYIIKFDENGEQVGDYIYWSSDHSLLRLCLSGDNGFLATGCTRASHPQDERKVLLKFDYDGDLLWNRTFEDCGYKAVHSIEYTLDKGFIMISYDYIIKVDENGMVEWKIVLESDMTGYDILQSSDGDYIATGKKDDNHFGIGWMVRINENGVIKKWKYFHSISYAYWPISFYQINDGGFIITGQCKIGNIIEGQLWLAKTDNEGNIRWDKRYGKITKQDVGCSIQQTTDSGFIVFGNTHSYGNGNFDAWLIKTDSEGNTARNRVITNSFLMRLFELFPNVFRIFQIFNLGRK